MINVREFKSSDATALVHNANNPNVAEYLRDIFPSPYTLKDAQWWLSEGCRQPGALTKAIEFNGECIGSAGITYQENEHAHSVEIGYWLGEDHWGKGIASEVLSQMTELAFEQDGILRIFAATAAPNVGSMRVLEKCGYTREGVFKNGVCLRGHYFDEHVFAMNRFPMT